MSRETEVQASISRSDAIQIYKECRGMRVAVPASVTTTLRRLLSGTDNLGQSSREESGRVDRKAFTRFAVGDGNIFSRRTRQEGEDCAVSILLDLSASMDGSEIKRAQQVVIQLGAILDGCRVQWSCTGYSTHDMEWFYNETGDDIDDYVDHVSFVEIKAFKQSSQQAAAELGAIRHLCGSKTPDFAAPILHLREMDALPVSKKVLILLTDATSLHPDECKFVREFADKLGINLVVIGICAGTGLSYYGDAAVNVNNLSDLSSQAFGHLLKRVSGKHRVCA
jgi:hypothetical protein